MEKDMERRGGLTARLAAAYEQSKIPFWASILAGLAAHMFMLTNKLPNHDDVESLFGKGATITSGRWGLEIVKALFPDRSMPWIYGVISIVLIAAAVCLMVKLLDIRSRAMQALVGALVLTFPSLTGTFCFMFTSSAYALAFLMAVAAVWEFQRGRKAGCALGALMLIFSLSIYQAYIAVTAGLFVLIMLKRTLEAREPVGKIILYGFKALAYLAAAAAIYYAATALVLKLSGAEFNDYVTGNVNERGLLGRVRMAYDAFLYVFTFRNFYLVPTEGSRYLHIAYAAVLVLALAWLAIKTGKPLHMALAALLTLLLPLAMNSMYLIMSGQSIHTLVLYSFVCFYLLGAVAAERLTQGAEGYARKGIALMLGITAAVNICFANMCYLKLNLQYENASAFYKVMIARVTSTEGFDEGCDLAVIGEQRELLHTFPELDTALLMGPGRDMVNIYSRENFLRRYMGFDMEFATQEEIEEIKRDARYEEMPIYPYYGSVARLGEHIVVKLG